MTEIQKLCPITTGFKKIFIALLLMLALTSCRKQPQIPQALVNEPENITKVKLTFTDSANASSIYTASWNDADGAGGNAPIVDNIALSASKTYFTTVEVLDETKNPVANISNEISKEADQHQFFFIKSNANVSFAYADADANGNPLGLKTRWRTGSDSTGNISVILKHQPGVKVAAPGDINAGNTDIDVSFKLVINN
jgi:hypothetical protein